MSRLILGGDGMDRHPTGRLVGVSKSQNLHGFLFYIGSNKYKIIGNEESRDINNEWQDNTIYLYWYEKYDIENDRRVAGYWTTFADGHFKDVEFPFKLELI